MPKLSSQLDVAAVANRKRKKNGGKAGINSFLGSYPLAPVLREEG
jgi:hypothetical protein